MELDEARAIAEQQGATHELIDTRRVVYYRPDGDRWQSIAYFVHPRLMTMWLSVPGGLPRDARPIGQEARG